MRRVIVRVRLGVGIINKVERLMYFGLVELENGGGNVVSTYTT